MSKNILDFRCEFITQRVMNSRKQIGICNRNIIQKTFQFYVPNIWSSLAQPVEHAAVNRRVVGSSPTRGAKKLPNPFAGWAVSI